MTNIVFILALFLIFVMIPLVITSLFSVHEQVQSDVTYYSRGSYDLLVRPEGNNHPLEEELGLVPENYIGFGAGGISLEQWERIKSRADIEIAAPVASLGYFTGIGALVAMEPPQQSTRYTTQFYTSDGVNKYEMEEESICMLLESPHTMYFEEVFADRALLNECYKTSRIDLPSTYHLLVGIDPEEEEKLTGISFEFIRTGWGNIVKADYNFTNAKMIPILEFDHEGGVSLSLEATVDHLPVGEEEMEAYQHRLGIEYEGAPETEFTQFSLNLYEEPYKEITSELLAMPATESVSFEVDVGSYLDVFFQKDLVISETGDVEYLEDIWADGSEGAELYEGAINPHFLGQYYAAGHLSYVKEEERLKVKQVSKEDDIPLYRNMKREGYNLGSIAEDEEIVKQVTFITDPIGTIEMDEREEQLASSPLGIYQFAPVYHVEGDKKTELKPIATPGSFVSAPAKGVTKIDSAAVIKGDEPIDAIRVRVAGIDGYTKQAAEQIDDIAKEIEAMGLQVTIVAGASAQKMLVDVEGIGLVEESWTTLGAAGTIISEWNITTLLLAILFFIVMGTYLINRLLFWQVSQKDDILLLNQLGWRNQDITRFSRHELLLLTGFAYILAIGGLLGLNIVQHFSVTAYLWQLVGALFTCLIVIVMLRNKTKSVIKGDNERKKKLGQFIRKRHSITWKNLTYFSPFIRSPFFQLLVVSTLSSIVYLSLGKTVEETNITLLGEYINLQLSEWHIILTVAAYLLGIFTLVEGLFSMFHIREKEIKLYRMLGWKQKHMIRLYLREIAIWSGLAIGIGTIVSGVIYFQIYTFEWDALYILAASFLGFYLIILVLAYFTILRIINKEYKSVSASSKKLSA